MNWQQICEDPNLQNLPYKIELNERGQILMSPAKLNHARLQGKIIKILNQLMKEGETFPECAIFTRKGTKVADVVWCSPELCQKINEEIETSVAPEICVEVISPTNTATEMDEKRILYFEQGAQEVWMCDELGNITFFHQENQMSDSLIVPNFPGKIKI